MFFHKPFSITLEKIIRVKIILVACFSDFMTNDCICGMTQGYFFKSGAITEVHIFPVGMISFIDWTNGFIYFFCHPKSSPWNIGNIIFDVILICFIFSMNESPVLDVNQAADGINFFSLSFVALN